MASGPAGSFIVFGRVAVTVIRVALTAAAGWFSTIVVRIIG
jgi:hypothetical protein